MLEFTDDVLPRPEEFPRPQAAPGNLVRIRPILGGTIHLEVEQVQDGRVVGVVRWVGEGDDAGTAPGNPPSGHALSMRGDRLAVTEAAVWSVVES